MKGIDVSSYQGVIDWNKFKNSKYQFVILRLGIGDDVASQDDEKFSYNLKKCQELGIPYAFYLVSYAKNLEGEESVQSEIAHTERLIQGTSPFCIFYDMEVDSIRSLGREKLTRYAIRYCDYFRNLGYQVGVYANKNWFSHYLDYDLLREKGYKIWLAHYGIDRASLTCDLWQYTDKGVVEGISSNTVDLNEMYGDFFLKKDVEEIVLEVIAGRWGNGDLRKQKLIEAGYSYDLVQKKVNERLEKKQGQEISYVVKKGDTLSSIALKYQSTYQEIAAYNGIGDVNKIYAGEIIRIPIRDEAVKREYYVVKRGDNLTKISKLYRVSIEELMKLNSIQDANLIYIGQRLRVK